MTKLEIKLKNKIMRRVYAVWLLKKIISLAFLRFIVLCGFAFEFAREVSVISVFGNLPAVTDFGANFNYFAFAFSHTELSVQIYLVGIITLVFWYALHETAKIATQYNLILSNRN
ncbi:MAG TPA: hypothetical protein P5056_03795 [Candidatus Paceibacterota bacterium]|nr:hypothetical protein [Candidatus Paceibacterota bacterium]